MKTILIPLTLGLSSLVDIDDGELLSGRKWQARRRRDGKGFYAVDSNGVRMHRLLLCAPSDKIVDHVNGDGLDNRRSNIRVGTQSQNCVNRKTTPGPYLRGTRPRDKKWQAYIKHRGKFRNLGFFTTELEAHQAYVNAAIHAHGDWMPLPAGPVKSVTTEKEEA